MSDLQVRPVTKRPAKPLVGVRLDRGAPKPRRTPRLHAWALRIDAATPPGRDRAVDVLRALAILGVVLGHWLVSAVVLRSSGHLTGESPLRMMPGFTPVSWVLQTLAVFFFVGGRVAAQGYAAAQERGTGYRVWVTQRMRRLLRPVVTLLAVWLLVVVGLAATGVAHETIRTLLHLVVTPLWFLLVFAALTAATPLFHRIGWQVALGAALLVAVLDLAYFVSDAATWADTLRNVNVPAGWLVPYGLGAAWASGKFSRRRVPAAMLAAGLLATAALIIWCGYPTSMVGVPGGRMSNLNPPSLVAVTFGLAQCGAALLACGTLRRMVGRPPADARREAGPGPRRATAGQFVWAAVAVLNLSAITVFLWHQTAMLGVTVGTLGTEGPLSGLHTAPDQPAWIAARIGWIPVFAVVLTLLCIAFRDTERKSRASRASRARTRRTARTTTRTATVGQQVVVDRPTTVRQREQTALNAQSTPAARR